MLVLIFRQSYENYIKELWRLKTGSSGLDDYFLFEASQQDPNM